ncbi:hypothetical protein BDV96DRAFT_608395 [Lophiotrema nucula]|uniref:Fungal-specific transcription factor domain-containing protein n=1 Tax=Lophiotrema nucula TaxID=690887 RepID=A0A6A5YDT0_9PLEO|nr:hypothetical protein BDV96DRAFT_608395 [Lophiotrema nucula]
MANPPNTTFTFINVSHPSELKRQEMVDHIRCSAMTNFGKMRRKRRAKAQKNEIVFELQASEEVAAVVPMSRIGIDAADPFEAGHLKWDAEATRLMGNIFGANNGQSPALLHAWQSVAFYDEFSFQTAKAIASLNGEKLRRGTLLVEDTPESLALHNKALQMLSKRLDDPQQHTSDSVIGAMSGLLTYDWTIGNFEGWNWHMSGLLKMINLRGGIRTLSREQMHITLAWTDICGAYAQDIAPHFPMPKTWQQAIEIDIDDENDVVPASSSDSIIRTWKEELPEYDAWISIFKLIVRLVPDHSIPANCWMEPIIHRLLSLRPMRHGIETRGAIIEEACRIGTLLFLSRSWREFGVLSIRTTLLRRNLLAMLRRYFAEWGRLRPLLLWVLVQAAQEAESQAERYQFNIRISMVMSKLNIADWDGLVEVLKGVVWSGEIADAAWEPGQRDLTSLIATQPQVEFENCIDFNLPKQDM